MVVAKACSQHRSASPAKFLSNLFRRACVDRKPLGRPSTANATSVINDATNCSLPTVDFVAARRCSCSYAAMASFVVVPFDADASKAFCASSVQASPA